MSNKLTDTQLIQEIQRVLAVEEFPSDAVRRVREIVTLPVDPMAPVREAIEDLCAHLELWTDREEHDPAARAAADAAVDRIDTAQARLRRLREQLVEEIRQTDAAFLALDDNPDVG